jgi:murein DD-endopeptidase MepM/ murein hydrolase activator NlpD
MARNNFEEWLNQATEVFAPVVPSAPATQFLQLDLTEKNKELTPEILQDTQLFTDYINSKLAAAGARYGIGGYNEDRPIYSRSAVFDAAEPRRLHLGVDIWAPPYTRVMAPLDGIVHSFAFNNAYGDYGTTVILTHNLHGLVFHTLYGHLSLNSIANMQEGDVIRKGNVFAGFGIPMENGQWPPHLHFQVIIDMEGKKGDYPGVCAWSEREKYLSNCPDPALLLNIKG